MAPRPRKRFAQHWLRSEKALHQIVDAAELTGGTVFARPRPPSDEELSPTEPEGDCVLEIGPGLGVLTQQLLRRSRHVVAVELDRDLCRELRKTLGNPPNFLLLQGDFLTLDLPPLLQDFPDFQSPNKVVANIPYNITGPILEKLLGTIAHPNPNPYDCLVLLLQKEVAQRLCARPGKKAFGALSVRVQYLAECDWICDVPARAFQPPPKVDSAVVRLRPRRTLLPVANPKQLDTLVKVGFATRRKMLRNNLKSLWGESIPDAAVADSAAACAQLLEQLGLNPQARAEDLSVEDWVALSNAWDTRSPAAHAVSE